MRKDVLTLIALLIVEKAEMTIAQLNLSKLNKDQ
jgi:hypothetical protein